MKLTKSQAVLDDNRKLVSGTWELDKKHRVTYRSKGGKETAALKARILDIKPAALSLQLTHSLKDAKTDSKVFDLEGEWRLDSKNRIIFEVRRKKGKTDTLTFKNAWELNETHEVTYTYEEEALKTKKKYTRTFAFRGHWDVLEKNRLTYVFTKETRSFFKVRGVFQTRSILAKKGELRYQFGIEIEKRIKTQTLVLFGKWKVSTKWGLSFDIEYKNGERHAIVFGGEYRLDIRDKVEISLKSRQGKRLGIQLILTRDFLKTDGKGFIRFLTSEDESRVEGGLEFAW